MLNQRTEHLYDAANRLTAQNWQIGDRSFGETYTYNQNDGSLTEMNIGSAEELNQNTANKFSFAYDSLKRLSNVTVKQGNTSLFKVAQSYVGLGSSRTTTQIEFFNYRTPGGTLLAGNKYVYDNAGNIQEIRESESPYRLLYAYTYDSLNQLTQETRYTYSENTTSTITTNYNYDTAGNLLSVTESVNGGNATPTAEYTYGNSNWADLLTKYNGHTISYSGGNPTNWYNGSDLVYTSLYWTQGRRLCAMQYEDSEYQYQIEYEYDMSGIRTRKITDEGTHNYVTQSGKVVRETYGTVTLDFFYDANGRPFALEYADNNSSNTNTGKYYYVLNAQGDVVGLLNSSGTLVARYTYDAWGKPLSVTYANGDTITDESHVANVNPLRYRSYYYDRETGWYYLQSRYYDPVVKRFLNADTYASTGQGFLDYNMFAYCANNPVANSDPSGESWMGWAAAAAVVIVLVALSVATCGGATAAACTAMAIAAGTCGASTAATVTTAAAVGAATAFTASAVYAASESHNLDEFAAHGEGALVNTAVGAAAGGFYGTTVCFIAGTLVKTDSGNVPIEQIEPGDLVWAWNEETADVALQQVVETYVNETYELVHVFVSNDEIVCTPSHPFYSPVKGWTSACKLRAGDVLVLINGEYVVVEKVQHELLESPIKVYNFQVQDYHTYYVSASGTLVHNSCETDKAAEDLGYHKVNGQKSHGQPVYTNSKAPASRRYITPDVDSHNGGYWKAARTIRDLASKATRSGTYNKALRYLTK